MRAPATQPQQQASERSPATRLGSTPMLRRRCACGGTPGADGECAACKARRLSRSATRGAGPAHAPAIVHDVLRSAGRPLEQPVRTEMEQRLGHDFSRVRVHADGRAADSARAVDANAYAVGPNVVFGAGRYAPATHAGKQLLAHELAHTAQQADAPASPQGPLEVGSPGDPAEREASAAEARPTRSSRPMLRREPLYPDATCDNVKSNITRAWPTARSWAQNASRRLANPRDVASALGHHFKLDPNDTAQAADLAYVQRVMARTAEIFDTDVDQRCDPPNAGDQCRLPDGREYGAWVNAGNLPGGIHHCITNADHGVLMGEYLIETLVHEVAHLADNASTDIAYHAHDAAYQAMTRAQALVNADSYAEFARELYEGGLPRITPLVLSTGTGVLLGGGSARPLWAITASYDVRSRTGLEVFDLVGGLHGWIGLGADPATGTGLTARRFGGAVDLGVISRSAETGFFVDLRAGAFISSAASGTDPSAAGVSARGLIGWASSGFRIGVDTRLLYDVLQANHGVIIGIEIGGNP